SPERKESEPAARPVGGCRLSARILVRGWPRAAIRRDNPTAFVAPGRAGQGGREHRSERVIAAHLRERTGGQISEVRGGAPRRHRLEERGAQRPTPPWSFRCDSRKSRYSVSGGPGLLLDDEIALDREDAAPV